MTTITRNHYLSVNGVPLSTPAWWVTNLEAELLSTPDVRGSDTLVPAAAGMLANPRIVTATTRALAMVILGGVDSDGNVNADQMAGLVANVEYLQANLGFASATGDGTVTAVWHRSNATTKTFPVTVLGLHCSKLTDRPQLSAVLELSIPAGVLPAAV